MAQTIRPAIIAMLSVVCLGCHKKTVACYTNGLDTSCSVIPSRTRSNVVIRVHVDERHSCSVDGQPLACTNVAKTIRSAHPSDDPTVAVCADRTVTAGAMGPVLGDMSRENLTFRFDCSSGKAPGAT